jgi:glycosyltransferase involved in cell wall biosynthesis
MGEFSAVLTNRLRAVGAGHNPACANRLLCMQEGIDEGNTCARVCAMEVSVLVTTYNRSADLARFLERFEHVRLSRGRSWEMIVVDNRSTDDTAAIIRKAEARGAYQLKHLFEGRQGKSFGLNTGIAEASGRIVAFTDDDVLVPEEWLERTVEFFDTHPEAVCIGGRVELYDPADLPTAILTATEPAVIDSASFYAPSIPILGCNMAMRAELLREIGPFDTDVGPGSRIGVAEDLDYLYRVLRVGHRIHYVPEVWVQHNHGRRRPQQLAQVMRGYLMGRGAFYCKHIMKGDSRVARWAYWDFLSNLGIRTLRAPFDRGVRKELRNLWLMLKGAVAYVRWGQRPAGTG